MENIIKVQKLTKNYGNFSAVDNITFNIKTGEIFGFLGPNGAGKTTTINMLIGMTKISGGKIFYKDEDLTNNIKEAQKIIGVVADESNLYDEMSGYENLCFCGSLYGMAKASREKRALELLETFQLSEAAKKKFNAYSKGMKRKLTIAAAIIHQPEILFLDEPTTGIDVVSARQIRNLIKQLNEDGATIFLTTHYIEEAERLCDRVAFINNGKILKIDTVRQLIEDTKENNIVEVTFEPTPLHKDSLLEEFNQQFPSIECFFKNENTIRIISGEKIDISPVVMFLSSKKVIISEARLISPTLEDAFVKTTGIRIDLINREKK